MRRPALTARLAYPLTISRRPVRDAYRLTMAVAGFSPTELDITVQENTLLVTGKAQTEDEKRWQLFAPRHRPARLRAAL